MTTTRYVIARHGQFMIDLYRSEAVWSAACNDCLTCGFAWLDHSTALAKLKDAQQVLEDDELTLALVTLRREGVEWVPVRQQGVK